MTTKSRWWPMALHGPTQRAVFSVDLNQFLSTADRARVILWQINPSAQATP